MKSILLIIVGIVIGVVLTLFLVNFEIFFPTQKKVKINMQKISPTTQPAKIELTGWFASWDQEKAEESLPPVMKNFTTFAPMLYRITPLSRLGRHDIENREAVITIARDNKIPIAPVVTDESDSIRVNRLLTNAAIQDLFISSLASEAAKENFIGWSIDIEKLKGSNQQKFSEFIKKTYHALHAKNLKLFLIVYARKEKEEYDPALAHDYQTLAKYADQIQIMTYNYNNEFTSPGSQTPLDWYRSVLRYAVKTIPKEKILIGLSTHGYDWQRKTVKGLTYPEVIEVLDEYSAIATHNAKQSSKVARYKDTRGREHELWFEDATTIDEKVQIAQKEFGINKFALWRLSAEDTSVWKLLKSKQ